LQIEDVIFAPGDGGFFYDDQAAIRAGAKSDGFRYLGKPLTAGFTSIRMPAASLCVGLALTDGTVVWGDMTSVQYSAAGGRDPLPRPADLEAQCRSMLTERLRGRSVARFRDACSAVLNGIKVPAAISYGVSQTLLRATAHAHRLTMAEVICREYGLPLPSSPVPLYAQSGDAREANIDKMILKTVDVLPHGLINAREKFGRDGGTFREFIRQVVRRIGELGAPGYKPVLHFDVYGWIGLEIGLEPERIAEFIARAAGDAAGYLLQIESPADYGSRNAQLEGYARIVQRLAELGSDARIVVDEQCNTLEDIVLFASRRAAHLVQIKTPDVGSIADTIEAALVCKQHAVGAFVGGSCVETDLSAQVSVHVAVATQADMMLAKPGMGVDEALSIMRNEQSRLFALLAYNRHRSERSLR
jgi:methylaspartate ammonia-lyase